MIRYCILYMHFLRFSLSRAMEFRLDFFFRIFMDSVFYAVNILFYQLIYHHTSVLGGWNEAQILVFVGGYLFVDAVIMTFVSNNLWWIPIYVNRGDIDYYLVRPISSLFFLTMREFSVNSSINLLISVGIISYAIHMLPGNLNPVAIIIYVLLLLMGTFLYFLVRLLSILPVFWTVSGRGMDALFWQMSRFMERPDAIFTGWIRRILLSILPFGLMASYPARIFLDGMDWFLVVHMASITLLFLVVTLALWKVALRNYTSASS